MDDALAKTAMAIILAAGDGREKVYRALDAAAAGDFAAASDQIKSAQADMTRAHQLHTTEIQAEAKEGAAPYSMLFAHAQDTLMTAYSEFRLMKKVMPLLESFDVRLKQLEERNDRAE